MTIPKNEGFYKVCPLLQRQTLYEGNKKIVKQPVSCFTIYSYMNPTKVVPFAHLSLPSLCFMIDK